MEEQSVQDISLGDAEVAEASVAEASDEHGTRAAHERPLYKLSVRLIDTYKLINKVYYENKARKTTTSHKEWDDENHDYLIHQGEVFAGRFEIKRRIGKVRARHGTGAGGARALGAFVCDAVHPG